MRPVRLFMLLVVLGAAGLIEAGPTSADLAQGGDVAVVRWPRSDGTRYVVFHPAANALRVYDSELRSSRDVALSEACSANDFGGGLADAGGAQALVDCHTLDSGPFDRALLVDAATGVSHEPTGLDAARSYAQANGYQSLSWYRVGAQWIAGAAYGYHNVVVGMALNWRTGELRVHAPKEATTTVTTDLDRPELYRALCPPLRLRPIRGVKVGPPWQTFGYDPPFGVESRQVVQGNSQVEWLFARRCGSAEAVLLDDSGTATAPQTGSGLATWTSRDGAHAYDFASRLRVSWFGTGGDGVLHTARAIFTLRPDGVSTSGVPVDYAVQAMARPRVSPTDPRLTGRVGKRALHAMAFRLVNPKSATEYVRELDPRAGGPRLPLRPGARIILSGVVGATSVQWRYLDSAGRGVSRRRTMLRSDAGFRLHLLKRVPRHASRLILIATNRRTQRASFVVRL